MERGLAVFVEVIALYDEHEQSVELLMPVYDGDEVTRIAMGQDLEEVKGRTVSSGYQVALFSSPHSLPLKLAALRRGKR